MYNIFRIFNPFVIILNIFIFYYFLGIYLLNNIYNNYLKYALKVKLYCWYVRLHHSPGAFYRKTIDVTYECGNLETKYHVKKVILLPPPLHHLFLLLLLLLPFLPPSPPLYLIFLFLLRKRIILGNIKKLTRIYIS